MTLPPFPSTNIAHGALFSPCHHPSCPPPYLALPLTQPPPIYPFLPVPGFGLHGGPQVNTLYLPFLSFSFLLAVLWANRFRLRFAGTQIHTLPPPTPLGVWVGFFSILSVSHVVCPSLVIFSPGYKERVSGEAITSLELCSIALPSC